MSGTETADEGATFSPSRPVGRDGLPREPEPADARRPGGKPSSEKKRLSTFSARRPVEMMASHPSIKTRQWAACAARMEVALWLLQGGRPPRALVDRCHRNGYGLEVERLERRKLNPYYPLHTF